ncbi:uncharacterized protein JCM15063_000620 [Sporobolomyces koalae]|uniref:uncharacterized protein n=1 Tax=Sporobolomyces koalae TaxID=500713 RepID=UPI00316D8AF1
MVHEGASGDVAQLEVDAITHLSHACSASTRNTAGRNEIMPDTALLDCQPCLSVHEQCDHLVPCSSCTSSSRSCTYPRQSSLASMWADVPSSGIQRWPEYPRLTRGGIGSGRLRPVKNGRGVVDELEWEPLVDQNQDLRIKPHDTQARTLAPSSIIIDNEAEHLDLVGDPVPHVNDNHLLSGLHSALPDLPLHPTIFLNAHLSAHPPLPKSRIATAFEPSNLNRGNCIASAHFGPSTEQLAVVWRTGDERYLRPTAVAWGTLNEHAASTRKGKSRALDQDESVDVVGVGSSGCDPLPRPIFTHHTPIHQLQLASLDSSALLLGVQSHTSLDIINLALPTPFDPGKVVPPTIESVTSFSIPRTTIADFALGGICQGYGEPGSGFVVDVEGNLFGFGLDAATRFNRSRSQPELFSLRTGPKKGQARYSGFSRVTFGSNGTRNEAIVAVEDQVTLHDLRSPNAALELVGSQTLSRYLPYGTNAPAFVTSLLSRSPSTRYTPTSIHAVCTTRDVIWIDDRMVGDARDGEVLRWNHERVGVESKGVDRTLFIQELPPLDDSHSSQASVQRIALASRLNPHITIYTMGLDPTHSPKSLLDPYDIPAPTTGFNRVGLSISRTVRVTANATEETENDAMRDDPNENEEQIRRRKFLERMIKEQEATAMQDNAWRFIEVGMNGQVFERLVSPVTAIADSPGQEVLQSVAVENSDKTSELRAQPEVETIRLDMSAVIEATSGLALAGDSLASEDLDREGAVAILRAAVEEAREIESDVGALTAYELVQVSENVEAEPSPPSDSEQEDAQMAPTARSPARIGALPRASVYVLSRDELAIPPRAPTYASSLDTLSSNLGIAAAACVQPFNTSSTSHFNLFAPFPFSLHNKISDHADQLRQTYNVTDLSSVASLACDRVAADLSLSSRIFLPRPIEPDEPTDTPNQPQPAAEEPPPVHISYLRPNVAHDSVASDEDEPSRPSFNYNKRRSRKKPNLNSRGARLLLAEWHVGSDPRSYAWSNPYEAEKEQDDPYSQFSQSQTQSQRRKDKKRRGYDDSNKSSSQSQPPALSQSRFEFPSSFPAPPSSSQTYFPSFGAPPVLNVVHEEPASSSQDWTQAAATQPVISVTGPAGDGASQPRRADNVFGGANSQVVPGAFGARNSVSSKAKEKEKKKAKKRVSGF